MRGSFTQRGGSRRGASNAPSCTALPRVGSEQRPGACGAAVQQLQEHALTLPRAGEPCGRAASLIAHAGPPGSTAVQSDLLDFICAGPLLDACGLAPDAVAADFAAWERLGRRMAQQLGFDHDGMDDTQRLRVYHYYLPVYFWVDAQMRQHKQRHAGAGSAPPLVLGISAPQGCGKSTLVEQLEQLFSWLGVRAASVSIDDFYLTRADQAALAAAEPGNRLLQLRGNAGSHDLGLGERTLGALRGLTAAGRTAAVPRYDKSAFGGLGDRADEATWPVVEGPLDVVLFEGWMLGFAPVPPAAAAAVEPALTKVNDALAAYKEAWDSAVDSWLVIRIGDPQWVFGWRLQAEQRMRAAGKAGMSDEQIADFVSRYIPAYQAYLPALYARGPTTAAAGRTLTIEVDAARAPVADQPAPVL
ncbi:hypothetical protein Rsub_01699 [Raphidocelis subcapitata]|uniref:D-glycerate 3-kinase n=1 Tax=Raphidocelis subcapitata TaxID=307507 RepID=A0A2V0NMP5_9CHLO|nr:hypothetical protein Rsub_01699 [Raphidocelis subcapitata]|eukprot:GBF88798.1 hypothetical protein Rsub_01699 [Raphidocelis subcapitata]